jgi:SARP family transcriptional regulator, regulator of embCAB operon
VRDPQAPEPVGSSSASGFARCQAARAGDAALLDYLNPAGDLVAGERLDQLRMIAPDVALNPSDHVVVCLAPCDETTFAFDLPGHLVVAAIVGTGRFSYLASNLGERLERSVPPGSRPRIQLCGRFVLELDGQRIDAQLPSRQGRLLFAYLALNRDRAVTRDELVDALWPYSTPAAAPSALTVLVSKVRAALRAQMLSGRSELRLNLPPDVRIDVEDALEAVHEAQSAIALRDWKRAWGPALRAQFIARLRLLPEHDAPWLDQWRQRLDDVHDRALEAYAASCLGIGGTELPGAWHHPRPRDPGSARPLARRARHAPLRYAIAPNANLAPRPGRRGGRSRRAARVSLTPPS